MNSLEFKLLGKVINSSLMDKENDDQNKFPNNESY